LSWKMSGSLSLATTPTGAVRNVWNDSGAGVW